MAIHTYGQVKDRYTGDLIYGYLPDRAEFLIKQLLTASENFVQIPQSESEKKDGKEVFLDQDIIDIASSYKDKVYQMYAPANTLSSNSPVVVIQRISEVMLDGTISESADKLRRVRLQLDIFDGTYSNMILRTDIVRKLIERYFPSSIDNVEMGVDVNGTTIWQQMSIDVMLTEIDLPD